MTTTFFAKQLESVKQERKLSNADIARMMGGEGLVEV